MVFRIRRRGRVAAGALKNRIVGRVGVAGGANTVGITMIQREKYVVTGGQGGGDPRGRCMACGAGRRPPRCHMIGIRGPIEIRLVAGVTSRRRAGKDITDVAADAIHRDVRAGQWKGRVVVIKRCPCPCCGRVAGSAGGWKSSGSMVRVSRPRPIRQVATVAGGRQRREVVIGVTLRADQ